MKKGLFLILLLLTFISTNTHVQASFVELMVDPNSLIASTSSSKHQFRGLYIRTVDNNDFALTSSEEEFKIQFLTILDNMDELNMNTLVFQVRPQGDAFYKSDLNPWSRFLTGVEGQDPLWDPLKWMIEETHKRNFAFYASVNPFNVAESTLLNKNSFLQGLHSKNFARQNPGLVLTTVPDQLGRVSLYLNPANDTVIDFVTQSIMEILNHYEIDAIHLEGNLYPELALANEMNTNKIISFIEELKYNITSYNLNNDKGVALGISPIISKNSVPFDITTLLSNHSIDYIAPQIKWENEGTENSYEHTVDVLVEQVSGSNVNLYIGHYLNLSNDNSMEVPNQLIYNQKHPNISGSLLIDYQELINANNQNSLSGIKEYWSKFALMPRLLTIDSTPPESVESLSIRVDNGIVTLSWDKVADTKAYIIYRFMSDDTFNLNDTANIISIIKDNGAEKLTFIDNTVEKNNEYVYFITAIDMANNESMPQSFGVDLVPNQHFKIEMITFGALNFIALLVIIITGVKALKSK